MNEDLLKCWEVSRITERFGNSVDEINKEFDEIDSRIQFLCGDVGLPCARMALRVSKDAQKLIKEIEKTSAQGFDDLVQRQYTNALKSVKNYFDFWFNPVEKKKHIDEMLNSTYLFGDFEKIKFKDHLIKIVKTIHPLEEERQKLRHEFAKYEVDINIPGIPEVVQANYKNMKSKLQEYIISRNHMDKKIFNESFALESYQELLRYQEKYPKHIADLLYYIYFDQDERSDFTVRSSALKIGTDGIHIYRDGAQVKTAYIEAFLNSVHEHEHAFNCACSNYMPPGMNNEEAMLNPINTVIAEGVAMNAEQRAISWLNKNHHNFSENELKLGIINSNHKRYAIHLLYSYFQEKENRDRQYGEGKFDGDEEFSKITGIAMLSNPAYLTGEHFCNMNAHFGYVFGTQYVQKTLKKLKKQEQKKFKYDQVATNGFLDEKKELIAQGLSTGMWGPQEHQEFFLNHYWPKAREL